jgi:hypothetical protein
LPSKQKLERIITAPASKNVTAITRNQAINVVIFEWVSRHQGLVSF